MIRAVFTRKNGRFVKAAITGHAGFAESGKDIVCASVTSAVQLTANAITEILQLNAGVSVGKDRIEILLPDRPEMEKAEPFLEALFLHLGLLQEQFPAYLNVSDVEVQ